MKIVAFTNEFPPYRGGISTYAVEMARAATALGASVTMVAPSYDQDLRRTDRDIYPFEVVRYPGGPHRAWKTLQKIKLVREVLAAHPVPDLVHAIDWPFFMPCALSARALPRLISVHGSEILSMRTPLRRLALALSRTLEGEVRVVGNSRFTQILFRRHFPNVPASRVTHELLGVGLDWLDHVPRQGARDRFGLPGDRLVVLTLARLTRRKGHLTALSALRLLSPDLQKSIVYVIAGTGSEAAYLAELEAAIDGHPVDIMRFEGLNNDDARSLCAAADIFCLPGATVEAPLVEGFGLVLLEAAAMGLPAIAGNVGGAAEVVQDGESGLVIPTDDPAALATAITKLAADPALRRGLGDGARRRAEQLTWLRCARATYGL
jgi:glycosyltransferase involved in cell wall biosynthesis